MKSDKTFDSPQNCLNAVDWTKNSGTAPSNGLVGECLLFAVDDGRFNREKSNAQTESATSLNPLVATLGMIHRRWR
jgi:hypothetical protein